MQSVCPGSNDATHLDEVRSVGRRRAVEGADEGRRDRHEAVVDRTSGDGRGRRDRARARAAPVRLPRRPERASERHLDAEFFVLVLELGDAAGLERLEQIFELFERELHGERLKKFARSSGSTQGPSLLDEKREAQVASSWASFGARTRRRKRPLPRLPSGSIVMATK